MTASQKETLPFPITAFTLLAGVGGGVPPAALALWKCIYTEFVMQR